MGHRAVSRSANLLLRQRDALGAATDVRFIRQAITGTLPNRAFRRYLVIEEAFVLTAVRVLGLVVAESTTLDDAVEHVASLSNLVGEQRRYFVDLRRRFPIEGAAEVLIQESSVLSTYALRLVRQGGRSAAVVGMFAAETLYLSWCRSALLADPPREPALQEWIELHTRPNFVTQVQVLAAEVDGLGDEVTDAELDGWFGGMLEAEIAFHECATR